MLTILSDRQKGLIEGVDHVFPTSPHGYCMRHLAVNFHKKFKHPELTKLLWKAAKATTLESYNDYLSKMDPIHIDARPWLLGNANPLHWANIYFLGKRYGHYTSNIVESFNAWILEAREQPILAMFETIRHQLMNWYDERRQLEITTPGILIKDVSNKIQGMINNYARRYTFHAIDQDNYEITSFNGEVLREYRVNIALRTCSCNRWQTDGFPCAHGLAIILKLKHNPQMFAETFYHLNAFRMTYINTINHPHSTEPTIPLPAPAPAPARTILPPLTNLTAEISDSDEDPEHNDNAEDDDTEHDANVEHDANTEHENSDADINSDESDQDTLRPPTVRRQSGRPSNARKEADTRREKRARKMGIVPRAYKCGLCGESGHSQKTCMGPRN